MFRTPLILPLVAALWLAPSSASAQEQKRQDLKEQKLKRQDLKATAAKIAADVKALAALENQISVYLGEFNPIGIRGGDGRPALEHELRTALDGFLNDKSPLELYGTFEYTDGKDDEGKAIEGKVINIEAVLKDTKSKRIIKTIVAPILFIQDISRFLGPSGAIPDRGTSADARKALEKLQAEPTATPAGGTRVKPHANSAYAAEVRVKKDGAKAAPLARALTVNGGLPFVKIVPGEVYEVRVLNHSDQEAAFKLAIDGLDQFAFTEDRNKQGQPRYSHYILPPAKNGAPGETVVYGWHKKFDDIAGKHRYNEFLVMEYGKSGLSKPKAKVGMIELSFSKSFTEDAKNRARGDAETGQGKEGEVKGTVVKRIIDPPTEFLTIRYNREIK